MRVSKQKKQSLPCILSANFMTSTEASVTANYMNFSIVLKEMLASVAQSDARPTGDQEVLGSIHFRSATFCLGD